MSVPRVLNDRYQIGELLGRGGMADVYMAHDNRLGRSVAIKMLRPEVARDSHLQARFRREAQAVAGLNHPSIVAVYDTGEHVTVDQPRDAAHVPYIVMEYVRGKTLRDLIRSKDISVDQAIDYTLGVLAALDYSHRAGIVHRDIKPANVMVTQDDHGLLGQVKVMDFGIARTLSDAAATMTQTQTVMGTAQYLSPEQARGESVDARSDLYSAGCLLYEMLAGRPPFTGDSPVSVAYQHVREEPPVPSTFNPALSAALDAVLLHALQKDRLHRFQDAASFRRALRAAHTGVMPTPDLNHSVVPLAAPSRTANASTHLDDDGPSTRAMAKVIAGGALTTHDPTGGGVDEIALTTQRRRRAWMTTLFVALAIVLGGGAVFGYNLFNPRQAAVEPVTIPVLAGFSKDDAMARLLGLGLEPHSSEEFSTTREPGDVIRTDPGSGALVNPKSTVEIYVSKGPSEVTIPIDLAGKTEAEVRDNLAALNLKFNSNDFVTDPTIAANLVVTTDPAPGKIVAVGTSVTLKISNGQVVMPSLFDLTKDPTKVKAAVTAALNKASPYLELEWEEVENSIVTPGMVTNQSVTAGDRVVQHAKVVVTVAKAPDPVAPTPTSPPSSSPAASPKASDPKPKKP